jgi:hypothetical protein
MKNISLKALFHLFSMDSARFRHLITGFSLFSTYFRYFLFFPLSDLRHLRGQEEACLSLCAADSDLRHLRGQEETCLLLCAADSDLRHLRGQEGERWGVGIFCAADTNRIQREFYSNVAIATQKFS